MKKWRVGMAGMVGKILLALALIVVACAVSLIVFAHLRPPIDPLGLLRFRDVMMNSAMSAFFITFFVGWTGAIIRKFKPAHNHPDRIRQPTPWYFRVFHVLIAIALLECIFSGYTRVSVKEGQWLAGIKRGTPALVPEHLAVEYLWRGLRSSGALILFVACIWTLLILNQETRRGQNVQVWHE